MTTIRTATTEVSDTPTNLTNIDEAPSALSGGKVSFAFTNTGSTICYLGGNDVTITDGTPLTPGEKGTLELPYGANVYAVCATNATTNVRTLQVL